MKIPFKIPRDKWLHIVIGTMFYLVVLMFFNWYVSIIATVLLGFIKELNDGLKLIPELLTSKGKTTFSLSDLVYTIILPLVISSILAM